MNSLREMLSRTGGIQHDVVVVRDGAEAVDWIFAEDNPHFTRTPDLVLLDLKLPQNESVRRPGVRFVPMPGRGGCRW